MSWGFYTKEGKLLYDVVASSSGDASTLDGIDSTGFVRIGAPGLNSGNVDIAGRFTLPTITASSNLALNDTHRIVLVDCSSSTISVTLPASPVAGQVYEIRDAGDSGVGKSATNNITVVRGNVAHTIDGVAADLVINKNGSGVTLVWDGLKWITLSDRSDLGIAVNADTLDSLDSSQFLRSDTDTALSGNFTITGSIYSPVDILSDTTNPNLLTAANRTVGADSATNTNPVTVTLPASPVVGQWYEIFDVNGSASVDNITIARNGSTINNVASDLTLDTDYDAVILVCTGSNAWSILSWRYPPIPPSSLGLDDLIDVTISGPTEGELLRYNTPANEWVNEPLTTIDDAGRLHLKADNPLAGISFGENSGFEASITWKEASTLELTGRTVHSGSFNLSSTFIENGISPVVVDTYEPQFPQDNVILCKTSSGDLFLRMPNELNALSLGGNQLSDGDVLTVKDSEGYANVNALALVAEGVRKRNVPVLSATSVSGVTDASTTTTPGGIGVDEVQEFKVTGTGTFKVTFDGQEAATVLNDTSTAQDVVDAINSLSPHPNYGYFEVSTSSPLASVTAGAPITFDGGTLIDGEAYFYVDIWDKARVIYKETAPYGEWFVI